MSPTKEPPHSRSRGRGRDEKNSRWPDSTRTSLPSMGSTNPTQRRATCVSPNLQSMGTGGQCVTGWAGCSLGSQFTSSTNPPNCTGPSAQEAWGTTGRQVGFLRTRPNNRSRIQCLSSVERLLPTHPHPSLRPRAFDPRSQYFPVSWFPSHFPSAPSAPGGLALSPHPLPFPHGVSSRSSLQSPNPPGSGFLCPEDQQGPQS